MPPLKWGCLLLGNVQVAELFGDSAINLDQFGLRRRVIPHTGLGRALLINLLRRIADIAIKSNRVNQRAFAL